MNTDLYIYAAIKHKKGAEGGRINSSLVLVQDVVPGIILHQNQCT